MLNAYNKSQQALKKLGINWVADITKTRVSITSKTTNSEQLWKKVSEFNPTQGWIQTLDKIHLIEAPKDIKANNDLIQTAELINASGTSVTIRPASRGQYQWTETQQNKQGQSMLMTTKMQYVNHTSGTLCSQYHVYWNEKNTRQPEHSCFIGFINKKDK